MSYATFAPADMGISHFGDIGSSALPPISQDFARPSTRETRRPATSAGILQGPGFGNAAADDPSSALSFDPGLNSFYSFSTQDDSSTRLTMNGLSSTLAGPFGDANTPQPESFSTPTPSITTTGTRPSYPSDHQTTPVDPLSNTSSNQNLSVGGIDPNSSIRPGGGDDFSGLFAHTVGDDTSTGTTLTADPADFRRQNGGAYSLGSLHPAMESYLASLGNHRASLPNVNFFGQMPILAQRPVTSSGINTESMTTMSGAQIRPRPPTAGGILNRSRRAPGSVAKGAVRFDAPLAPALAPSPNPTAGNTVQVSPSTMSKADNVQPAQIINANLANRRASEPFFRHVANSVNLPSHAKLYEQLGLQNLLALNGKMDSTQPAFWQQQAESFQGLKINEQQGQISLDPFNIAYAPSFPSSVDATASLSTGSSSTDGLRTSATPSLANPSLMAQQGQATVFNANNVPTAYQPFAQDYKFGQTHSADPIESKVNNSLENVGENGNLSYNFNSRVPINYAGVRNDSTSSTSSLRPTDARGSFSSDLQSSDYPKSEYEFNHLARSSIPSVIGPSVLAPAGQLPMPSQSYSYQPSSGPVHKKRPRRKFDQIERLYLCGYQGCEKSYGTLNHLNAHVYMQKHGQKRRPEEFKEIRKAWRQRKKEEARQAAERSSSNPNSQTSARQSAMSGHAPHNQYPSHQPQTYAHHAGQHPRSSSAAGGWQNAWLAH